jgi:2-C-methyl-D-erythritol 4-phosphate cytidylyltransferase/2-C-methyl-D-erythritol 2,4-cyclodiphosphate synthase
MCGELTSAASDEVGAIPLLESVDSLKFVDGGIETVPREKVFRTQTPQAFKKEDLMEILKSCRTSAADEAALWIDAGRKLAYVRGSEKNFKITTDFDWITAKALVETGRTSRVGIGYDIHELVPGRKLILGGVEIESPLGLLGHSDADIIAHAVSDALLGAAGEGDIGAMFPASDKRYKDADSTYLLKQVLELITGKGWFVSNIDVALKAQIPRMGDKISKITDNLKCIVTKICPYAELNIKVKSGEFVGSVGRAECMECFAVAAIEKYEF